MHDRRGLADHDAVIDRHDHVVARLGEIRGKPDRIDRRVEHVFGDAARAALHRPADSRLISTSDMQVAPSSQLNGRIAPDSAGLTHRKPADETNFDVYVNPIPSNRLKYLA